MKTLISNKVFTNPYKCTTTYLWGGLTCSPLLEGYLPVSREARDLKVDSLAIKPSLYWSSNPEPRACNQVRYHHTTRTIY